MSSVTIIIAIVLLLAALLCYAFAVQSIAHKRQKRARMLAGFEQRSRNFKFMLNGFPKGFLPTELTLLVQRSLLHVLEQLSKLDAANANHKEDMLLITQQMTETQQQGDTEATRSSIDNPEQSQEVKACLEELYKFVFHLEASRELSRTQADSYREMIKQLVLQLTIDSYAIHGRIARDKEKPQLALHYFNLGLNLILKNRNGSQFEGRINQLKTAIDELEAKLKEENKQPMHPDSEGRSDKEAKNDWNNFGQNDNSWKKKQIYD